MRVALQKALLLIFLLTFFSVSFEGTVVFAHL